MYHGIFAFFSFSFCFYNFCAFGFIFFHEKLWCSFKCKSSITNNTFEAKIKKHIVNLQAVRPSGISPESGSKVEDRKISGKKSQQSATSAKSLQNGASKTSGERCRAQTFLIHTLLYFLVDMELLLMLENFSCRRDTCTEKKVTDSQASDLLTEVALLKDKNKTMEDELREMQEKYSDVSLKFAEVEGERQQLVMTIRNLRNGQKK